MARKPNQTVQLKLRFPEWVRQRMEAAAVKNGRPMNTEIVGRLIQSLEKDDSSAAMASEMAAMKTELKLLALATTAVVDEMKIIGNLGQKTK